MFLSHVHSFRGLAIVGIVGAHCIHSLDWDASAIEYKLFDTLFNQSSIWFFFIAGLLFQHLSAKVTLKKYYINKLKNVILPYLILSIPALYASIYLIRQDVPEYLYEYQKWQQALAFLITGKHLAPFWFVPTISLFYLLAPVLLWLDKRPKVYLLLPVFLLLSALLGRSGLQAMIGDPLFASVPSKALYLFSVYWLGMVVGKFHDEFMDFFRKSVVFFWGASILCFSMNIIYFREQVHFIFLFKILFIPVLLVSLFKFDQQVRSSFRKLGDLSFGIFFIHGYVLAALKLGLPVIGLPSHFPGELWIYILLVALVSVACVQILSLGRLLLGSRSRTVLGV
ncbi:acyltransferase [Pseudomaricurvus alkylphenolicus]|uniref:acyltransferase family protein n=1 Tax=Pseudomaricurvus alkylphenolicus TaxID=1306991 RepID=UPI00141EDBC5|nr:acyltransferase [Pseudomaricurvus alkylphenolicus]NIB43123.1 acyltransferase [Pseudomaricurvus alkylphenolicus]